MSRVKAWLHSLPAFVRLASRFLRADKSIETVCFGGVRVEVRSLKTLVIWGGVFCVCMWLCVYSNTIGDTRRAGVDWWMKGEPVESMSCGCAICVIVRGLCVCVCVVEPHKGWWTRSKSNLWIAAAKIRSHRQPLALRNGDRTLNAHNADLWHDLWHGKSCRGQRESMATLYDCCYTPHPHPPTPRKKKGTETRTSVVHSVCSIW